MKSLTAFFVVLGLALSSVPGSSQTQTAVSEKKLKITLGYQPLTPTWGVTIVTGAKLWKPYLPNIEIERFESMSGMPLVNNILAGKVDIAYIGDMPAIVLGSKGNLTPSRFVSITDADEGGESVIYVKKGSPIQSVKALDGKTVSVPFGGFTHRFAEVVAETEKIKFKFVGQSPEVGLTNLQAGKVDAYIPWDPYGRMAVARGFGEPLVDGTKYHFLALRGVVVSESFARANPDVLLGWVRAELDAHNMMRERPDECAKIIFDDWKSYDVPLDVIRHGFTHKAFPDDIPQKWRNVLTDGAQFLLAHKFIEQEPDWSKFIDDSWLKKASAVQSQLK
jgi:NitT/TauT family transport system substrate-binding protein